jgi:hypothetical protein
MGYLQPGSQLAQCIPLVADSFHSVQGLVGNGVKTSDKDEWRALGVMVELW